MSVSKRDLFEQLEPPAGGRVHLRRRLEAERGRRVRRRIAVGATAMSLAAAATVITLWIGSSTTPRAPAPAADLSHLSEIGASHPALVSLGVDPTPAEPVVVRDTLSHQYAVRRVKVDRPDVVFYLVSSTAAPK
jgi:hypothetical protein